MQSRRLLALAAGLLLPLLCQAQSTFGSIVGNVKDPSGSAVAGAVVTITNVDENTSKQVLAGRDGAYEALNLKPSQCMMVAAHSGDLAAAAKLGLRTGHVGRPGEGGPGTGEATPKGSFDVVAKNFEEFAEKMGT